jgi:hypothetical protein
VAGGAVERAVDLHGLIAALAGLRDPDGVLSLTVGLEPGAPAGRTPAPQIALDNDLAALRRRPEWTRVHEQRLGALAATIEGLLEPAISGRGRALYVAVRSGEATELTLQRELPTSARLAPVARVLPLAAALEEGHPAGLVSIARDAVDVQEAELGRVRAVTRIELEPFVGDWWPEMKGAAAANPLRGQQVVSHRDRFDRRLEAAFRQGLREAVAALADMGASRGWARAVLAGDARLTRPLEEALGGRGVATTTIQANLEGVRSAEARERLLEGLAALVGHHVLEQAKLALARSEAGARGCCGLEATLAALETGRVERLLLDAGAALPGTVGADGTLSAGEGAEAGDLADWIVAHALAAGAAVTPVSGEAAGLLRGCGGIAGLLRW